MNDVVISGTGLCTPPNVVTNAELVEAYNAYADKFNSENAKAIECGDMAALSHSSVEFIEKASGIKQRYAMYKEGILDIDRMRPVVPRRSPDELSICAEMAVVAAKEALVQAQKDPHEIDLVICGSSTTQRHWPAVAVEIQKALGCSGYAYDMSVACSTATFAISNAMDALLSGSASSVLVVNPEYVTPQVNFRDRDSHFIFGDVATAVVLERRETAAEVPLFRILDRKLKTVFSNNIRTDFSYLTRAEDNLTLDRFFEPDQWFVQHGRKVFKELLPLVCNLVTSQLEENGVEISAIRRMWLHQANINMNQFAAQKLLGRPAEDGEAPIILDEYANTASAGAIIAFHKFHEDFLPGDRGIICSFGAGYSIGSLFVEKL
ncbi:MAG: beta-ketoacyl-ACP synthase III [Candidatus Marinimicrobia bacterium]|nr:beta-ketoacyl-ACP synthase III [Candidatus Neomarinimicrobiota bacterium]